VSYGRIVFEAHRYFNCLSISDFDRLVKSITVLCLFYDNIMTMSVGINVLMMIGQLHSNIVTGFKWIIEEINVHHKKLNS